MSDGTKIEWAANADGTPGASWNPIRARDRATGQVGWFCVHASDGCRNCYAEALNRRLGTGVDFKAQNAERVEVYCDERALTQPLRWKKPRTIFVCSMSDLFGEFVPDAIIDQIFAIASLCPQHTFIMLTKRADRMRAFMCADDMPERVSRARMAIREARWCVDDAPHLSPTRELPNVWLGVSVEANRNRDRLTDLIHTPAAVRFCSAEPLIEPLDLAPFLTPAFEGDRRKQQSLPILDWVIVGGESGPHARPMHPDWARDIRDQCARAGVSFFFKQWGEWIAGEVYAEGNKLGLSRHQDGEEHGGKHSHWWSGDCNGGVISTRVGKKAAGRMLDGRTHDDRPPLAHQTGAML